MPEDDWSSAQSELTAQFRRSRAKKEAPKTWLQRLPLGTIIFASLAVVVVVGIVTLSVKFVPGAIDRVQVVSTAKSFCSAVSTNNYSTADSMLSSGVRARFSLAQLATTFKQAHVGACETAQTLTDFTLSHARADMEINFATTDDSGDFTGDKFGGDMLLVQQDGGWKVDGFVALTGDILAS